MMAVSKKVVSHKSSMEEGDFTEGDLQEDGSP